MKKIIAVAGLGAAVAIGSLVGAGTANASTAGFESVVYSDTGYSGSSVVSLGYTTCDAITTFRQTACRQPGQWVPSEASTSTAASPPTTPRTSSRPA